MMIYLTIEIWQNLFVSFFRSFLCVLVPSQQQQMTQSKRAPNEVSSRMKKEMYTYRKYHHHHFLTVSIVVCLCVCSYFDWFHKSVALSTMLCDTLTISMAFRPLSNIKRTMK